MSDATQNGPVGDSSGREVKKVTRLPKYFIILFFYLFTSQDYNFLIITKMMLLKMLCFL